MFDLYIGMRKCARNLQPKSFAKKGKIFSPLRRGNKHMFHSSILFIGEQLTTQHKSHRICIYMRNEPQCLPRFPFVINAFSVLCRKFLHFNLFITYFDAFCVFLPFLFLTTRPLMYLKCSASAIAAFHGIWFANSPSPFSYEILITFDNTIQLPKYVYKPRNCYK